MESNKHSHAIIKIFINRNQTLILRMKVDNVFV